MAAATAIRLRPLGDRVLVKAIEKKDEIRGGLIIPDTAKEKPQEGEIIAAGKGKIGDDGKLIPMDVKAGDKILYGKYSGTEIKIDGQEYLIMHQEDILGIVE
jgi:chaperonin GroES